MFGFFQSLCERHWKQGVNPLRAPNIGNRTRSTNDLTPPEHFDLQGDEIPWDDAAPLDVLPPATKRPWKPLVVDNDRAVLGIRGQGPVRSGRAWPRHRVAASDVRHGGHQHGCARTPILPSCFWM